MAKKDEDEFQKTYGKYFAEPVIVILGMVMVGIIIDTFAGTKNIFTIIFAASGGAIAVGRYYARFWKGKK
jgi:F0F1-type ATP synthase assembly protein I